MLAWTHRHDTRSNQSSSSSGLVFIPSKNDLVWGVNETSIGQGRGGAAALVRLHAGDTAEVNGYIREQRSSESSISCIAVDEYSTVASNAEDNLFVVGMTNGTLDFDTTRGNEAVLEDGSPPRSYLATFKVKPAPGAPPSSPLPPSTDDDDTDGGSDDDDTSSLPRPDLPLIGVALGSGNGGDNVTVQMHGVASVPEFANLERGRAYYIDADDSIITTDSNGGRNPLLGVAISQEEIHLRVTE